MGDGTQPTCRKAAAFPRSSEAESPRPAVRRTYIRASCQNSFFLLGCQRPPELSFVRKFKPRNSKVAIYTTVLSNMLISIQSSNAPKNMGPLLISCVYTPGVPQGGQVTQGGPPDLRAGRSLPSLDPSVVDQAWTACLCTVYINIIMLPRLLSGAGTRGLLSSAYWSGFLMGVPSHDSVAPDTVLATGVRNGLGCATLRYIVT